MGSSGELEASHSRERKKRTILVNGSICDVSPTAARQRPSLFCLAHKGMYNASF